MNDPRKARFRDSRPHTVKRQADLILRYIGDDAAAITGSEYAVRRVATDDTLNGAVQLASGTLAEMESLFANLIASHERVEARRVTVDSEAAPGYYVYGIYLVYDDPDAKHTELVEIHKPRPLTDAQIDSLISLYARAKQVDVSYLYVALKSGPLTKPEEQRASALLNAATQALKAIELFQREWGGNLTESAADLGLARQALRQAIKKEKN